MCYLSFTIRILVNPEAAFAFYFLICLHLISHFMQRASGRKSQALIQSSENSLAWKEKHHPKMCQGLHLPGARQAWVRGPYTAWQPGLGGGVTIHALFLTSKSIPRKDFGLDMRAQKWFIFLTDLPRSQRTTCTNISPEARPGHQGLLCPPASLPGSRRSLAHSAHT